MEALAPDHPHALATEADTLENLHTELTTFMSQTFAKLQKRCQDVDPITQKPIYGEAQQKKVTEAYKLYTSLLSRTVALRAGPMDTARRHAEAARKAAEAQAKQAQTEAAAAQVRQRDEAANAQQEAQAAEARRVALEAKQRAALSSDAARARENKKREREQREEAAARKWAEARGQDVALMASIPKGVVGAEAGLALLKEACGGETSKPYKEAVAVSLVVFSFNNLFWPFYPLVCVSFESPFFFFECWYPLPVSFASLRAFDSPCVQAHFHNESHAYTVTHSLPPSLSVGPGPVRGQRYF